MIGYHYTTYSNWLKIQKEGMQPYEVYNQKVLDTLNTDKLKAIWVWADKLSGLSHKGQILYSAILKQNLKIALLKITYSLKEEHLGPLGQPVRIKHTGLLNSRNGDWTYHQEEVAILLKNSIKPENIELVKLYDLDELLI